MHGRPLIPTMRLKIRYKYAPHKLDNTVAVVRGGGGGGGAVDGVYLLALQQRGLVYGLFLMYSVPNVDLRLTQRPQ